MTIPGRGESVGEAYIRIFADGSGLNRSIRDEFKDTDKVFNEYGDRDRKAYQEGFHGNEAERKKAREDVIKSILPAKGEFDQVAKEYAGDFGKRLQAELEKAVGNKRLAERIFRNIRSEDLRSSGIGPELHRATEQLKRELEQQKIAKDKALAEDIARGRADRLFARQNLIDDLARRKAALKQDEQIDRKREQEGRTAIERALKFIETHDFGKFFGQGNRNNFINSFGNLVGVVARTAAFALVAPLAGLEKLRKGLGETGDEVEGFGAKLATVAKSGAAGLLKLFGGLSVGIIGLPVILKGALAGIQLFIGPLVALITDLAGVIAALASTISFGLVGAIAPLLPLLIPLIFGFAAVGLALQGMTGKSKAAADQIKKYFAPVVKQFKDLQSQVREGLFGKNNANAKALSSALVPVLKLLTPLLKGTAGAIGKSLVAFTKGLSGSSGKSFLQAFTKFNPVAINKLGVAFTHVFLGIGGVLRNLIPFALKMLNALDKSTATFDKFTNSKSGQDRMTKFFAGAAKSASLLWTFLKDVGKVLGDILAAGKDTGDSLFGGINKSLETYDKYLNSSRGQDALKRFFGQIKPFLAALGSFVGGFGKFFSSLNNGQSQNVLNTVLKSFGGLLVLIAKNIPSVIPILKDFATGISAVFRALAVVAGFIARNEQMFRPLIVGLGALYIASKFSGGTSLFGGLVGGFTLGVRQLVAQVGIGTNQVLTAKQKFSVALAGLATLALSMTEGANIKGAGGAAIGIGGGAIGGALIGTAIEPGIGTAVGAALGAIAGGIAHFWGNANNAAKEARDKQINYINGIKTASDGLVQSINGIGLAYTDAGRKAAIAALNTIPKGAKESPLAIAKGLQIDTKTLADAIGGDAAALQIVGFRQQSAIAVATQQVVSAKAQLAKDQAILDNLTSSARSGGGATGNQVAAARAVVEKDQGAVDKANGNLKAQKDLVDQLNTAIGVQNDLIRDQIILQDDQAAATKAGIDANLRSRPLTSQMEAYGNALQHVTGETTAQSIAVERNIEWVKLQAQGIGKSATVQAGLKKSVLDGAIAWVAQTKSLEESLTQAGYAKPVIDALIAQYDAIPPNIKTAITANTSALPPAVRAALVQLGLIPPDKSTTLKADNATAAGLAAANNAIKRWSDENHQVTLTIIPVISDRLLVNQIQHIRDEIHSVATATGGRFNGAQVRIIGEAGPEAVVPLRRPLGQVDPSVRALSAYAQGIPYGGAGPAQMAGGGVVSAPSSPAIVVQAGGALFATPTTDPQAVVSELMARLAMKVGG